MPSAAARPFIASFSFSDNIVRIATRDLSDEHARYRSRGGRGPSIAWTLGHLCQFRSTVLGILGAPTETSAATQFGNWASAGDDYPPTSELTDEFLRLGEKLRETLATVPEERFATDQPEDAHGAKSYLERLVFYSWHEAAHLGQVSGLRKEVGLPGTAELVQGA